MMAQLRINDAPTHSALQHGVTLLAEKAPQLRHRSNTAVTRDILNDEQIYLTEALGCAKPPTKSFDSADGSRSSQPEATPKEPIGKEWAFDPPWCAAV